MKNLRFQIYNKSGFKCENANKISTQNIKFIIEKTKGRRLSLVQWNMGPGYV